MREFRQQYATRAQAVLVNVAPIPACDNNFVTFAAQLDGVTSNRLLPLPIGLFNDQRHFTERGSTLVSRIVADELAHATGQASPAERTARTALPIGRAR